MTVDIIDTLVANPQVADLRAARPAARANAQAAYDALVAPDPSAPTTAEFSLAERAVVAAEVFPDPFYLDRAAQVQADPARLDPALDWVRLLVHAPARTTKDHIAALTQAGWSPEGIVSLGQLVGFLSFQQRVVHGLRALAGAPGAAFPQAVTYPGSPTPPQFLRQPMAWNPWVDPVRKADLTPEQTAALIKPERADMPYFRMLARDPAALVARTKVDMDIFYNTDGGLGRAERELAATVTSRSNGCPYCASVHSARTVDEGGDAGDVDKLLEEGPHTHLETAGWEEIRRAALALTAVPATFGDAEIRALRASGLDDHAIVDVINAVAFFNWANRLMLSLGEGRYFKHRR